MKAALVLCVIAIILAMAEGQNDPPTDGPHSGGPHSGGPPSGKPPRGCPPNRGTPPPDAPPLPPHCTQGGTSSQDQSTTTR